jgi:hypothetical protein
MTRKLSAFVAGIGDDSTNIGEQWTQPDDHFKGDNRDKLEVFNENREVIEQDARVKYLAGDTEADGSIVIRTGDL